LISSFKKNGHGNRAPSSVNEAIEKVFTLLDLSSIVYRKFLLISLTELGVAMTGKKIFIVFTDPASRPKWPKD
jgi:hypothetical protein